MRHFLKTAVIIGMMTSGLMVVQAEPFNIEKIKNILESRVINGLATGMVIGLIADGQSEIISLGLSDKQSAQAIDANSIFEIGSISKTFTAIILADMVQKGEVELGDPVAKYLPENVRMPERNGKQISLLDLATHRSGLPRLPSNLIPQNIENPYADYSVEDMYDFLSGYSLTRDIGEKTEYSNLGIGLLGHVLALKAGLTYEDLLQRVILQPLLMDDSGIDISDAQMPRFTTGYNMVGRATMHWDLPTIAGAGAIRSTGADMMSYLLANMEMENGSLGDAMRMSHTIKSEFAGEDYKIGLAWLTREIDGDSVVYHDGGTGGYRSFIGFDEAAQRGVFILTNSLDDATAIGFAILQDDIDPLKFKPAAQVENAKKYLGDYQLAPNFILVVTEVDGHLFVQATGQENIPIYYESENEFYYRIADIQISFEVDDDGAVTGLVLHQNGDHPAKKL